MEMEKRDLGRKKKKKNSWVDYGNMDKITKILGVNKNNTRDKIYIFVINLNFITGRKNLIFVDKKRIAFTQHSRKGRILTGVIWHYNLI